MCNMRIFIAFTKVEKSYFIVLSARLCCILVLTV